MKAAVWVCLIVLLAVSADNVAAEEGGEASDDFDLDIDLDQEDADAPGSASVAEPEEAGADVDFGTVPPEEQNRLSTCFVHTLNRHEARPALLPQLVSQMMKDTVSHDQVVNVVLESWMMACYLGIKDEDVGKARRGDPMTEDMERELFLSARPQDATELKWKLLQSFLAQLNKEQGPQRVNLNVQPEAAQAIPRTDPTGRPKDTGNWMYMIVVFGAIFGIAGLGILFVGRLGRKDRESEKEKSAKSQRKAEKAEKKLARKRIS